MKREKANQLLAGIFEEVHAEAPSVLSMAFSQLGPRLAGVPGGNYSARELRVMADILDEVTD